MNKEALRKELERIIELDKLQNRSSGSSISYSEIGIIAQRITTRLVALDDGDDVPITPEVLLGLGFKSHADRNNKAQLFFLNEFRYSMKLRQIKLLRSCDKAGESQRDACGFPFLTDDIPVESLRQLQTLYLALTGKELKKISS